MLYKLTEILKHIFKIVQYIFPAVFVSIFHLATLKPFHIASSPPPCSVSLSASACARA